MKAKKLAAILLAGAMIMGMSASAFAVEAETPAETPAATETVSATIGTAKITVSGLATRVASQDVTITQTKAWDATANAMVEPGDTTAEAYTATLTSKNGATVEFTDVPAGDYSVTVSDATNTVTYSTMVASTFSDDSAAASTIRSDAADVIVANDCAVVAKGTSINTDKTIGDGGVFVKDTEVVTFTVTATIPADASGNALESFTLYDEPENLKDLKVTSATVGGKEVTLDNWADAGDGVYTISLDDYVSQIGATVIVNYEATVDESDVTFAAGENTYAYKNTAYTNEDGTGGTEVTGYTGQMIIKKFDEKGNALAGATFKITNQTTGDVYEIADNSEADGDDADGVIAFNNIPEGTYTVEETQAPTGYSTVAVDDVTVDASDSANTTVTKEVTDTKLNGLPSTGGIGTTIFTIAGCVIIIAAVAIFFASRRKKRA